MESNAAPGSDVISLGVYNVQQKATRINATTDTAQLKALSFAVPALASRLSVENVRTSLPICMRYLVGTQDPDQIGALALASRTLADLLPAEARARALAPVQLRVDTETDPDRLARLSSVIPALALGMTPAQADALFPRLTSAMENTLYADQLLTLKVAAAAVTTKVSRDTVAPFVAAVAKALASASDIDRIDALTATMQALGARTDAGLQGDLRLTLIAWSATPDQAAAAVRAFLETPTGDSGEVRVQSLVEILKYPTVTGQAAHHVLDALRVLNAQAPGGDAGLDASLRWLATTYPGLRIDTAPVCPSPILPALKCPSTAGVSLFGLGAAGR